jgi:formate/nitrite transporter FocA (FNT family)
LKNLYHKITKKREDQSTQTIDKPKEVAQILEEQIEAGLKEFNRSNFGLFISSFAAGLEIGFSILFMSTIFTTFHDQLNPDLLNMYLAMCYPIGFIFVIIGRSELFTEHTALAILPVLNKSVSIKDLFILWGLVYLGNILGGFLFGLLLVNIGPSVGFADHESFYQLAHKLIDHEWSVIFFSALLAGWMMGLLGWLVTSSQETISRIIVIILVTFIIGLAGLHHCIVGSIEVFAGMLVSDDISLGDYLVFQVWASIGNAIGGAVFVAILKYSHVKAQ